MGRNDGGRIASQKENPEHLEAENMVSRFAEAAPAGWATTSGRARLVTAVAAALGRGCTRHQILDAFNQPLPTGDVHDLSGLMAARMVKLDTPNRPSPRPPWCGRCDQRTRQLWDDVAELSSRCPECHPLTVGVAA
jgi:hypothetical protein